MRRRWAAIHNHDDHAIFLGYKGSTAAAAAVVTAIQSGSTSNRTVRTIHDYEPRQVAVVDDVSVFLLYG